MASPTALIVLYSFSVLVLCCLHLHGARATTKIQAWARGLQGLATTAFVPSVLANLVLAPLLLYAHVRALGHGGGGAGAGGAAGGRRLVTGLSKVTVLAATVALLACVVLLQLGAGGVVVQLGADGHLDRGRGDVARLNIK